MVIALDVYPRENTLSCEWPLIKSCAVWTVTPRDICRFLVHKDKNGKTQVPCNRCPHLGKRGTFDCACLLRLSYKTLFISTKKQHIKHHWIKCNWDAKPNFLCELSHPLFKGLGPSTSYSYILKLDALLRIPRQSFN